MIVESEWSSNPDDILGDFDKIAVIKAPFKLMIYSTYPKGSTSSSLKERFEEDLSNYQQHIKGETYIFLEFMPKERAQAFVWQPENSGPTTAVVLESLISVMPVTRPKG